MSAGDGTTVTTARAAQIVNCTIIHAFLDSGGAEHRYGSERQYRLHGRPGPLDHLLRRPPTRTDSNFGPPFCLILGPKIREIREIRKNPRNFENSENRTFSKKFRDRKIFKKFRDRKIFKTFQGRKNFENFQGRKFFKKFQDRKFSKFFGIDFFQKFSGSTFFRNFRKSIFFSKFSKFSKI